MRYRTHWIPARVVATADLSPDVRQLEIQPDGGPERFTAGAHLDVQVYVDGQPELRSYSLIGRPDPARPYRVAVKLLPDSRGGSRYMWSLAPGARVSVSQPQNNFPLSFGRPAYTLVAGGIGITPIVGMAQELLARGETVEVHYGAASRAHMPYAQDLHALLGERVTLYDLSAGERVDLDALAARLPAGGQLYVCGPLPMLDAAKHVWHARGLPETDLRFETFGASGRFAAQTFTVNVPRLGRSVTVPARQSLLDALIGAGIDMMYDCRRGECGLCAVDVVGGSGIVDHRDLFFSEEQHAANDRLCACVSRVVNGDVSIDLGYRGPA